MSGIAGSEVDSEYKFESNFDGDGSYQCLSCEFSSKSRQGVKQHISRMHKKKASIPLDLELIEKEIAAELGTADHEFSFHAVSPNPADNNLIPSTQADFNLDVTKMFNDHESSKETVESSPSQSTPKKMNNEYWKNKCEEKENELSIATVKIVDLEHKLREKDVDIERINETLEKHVEEIKQLKAVLASKDDLLQTAVAQVESENIADIEGIVIEKITRYAKYVSQLLAEIKNLKTKPR